MSTKCGGVPGSIAMRDELAERLRREYRFQQRLAHQYAGKLADAVGDDLSKYTATSSWVGKEARAGAGRCPEWCLGDRCGDRTTSGHVRITIERILKGQPGQG